MILSPRKRRERTGAIDERVHLAKCLSVWLGSKSDEVEEECWLGFACAPEREFWRLRSATERAFDATTVCEIYLGTCESSDFESW